MEIAESAANAAKRLHKKKLRSVTGVTSVWHARDRREAGGGGGGGQPFPHGPSRPLGGRPLGLPVLARSRSRGSSASLPAAPPRAGAGLVDSHGRRLRYRSLLHSFRASSRACADIARCGP